MDNPPTNSTETPSSGQHGIVDHGNRTIGARFELKIDIDPSFYGRIIGAQGNMRRQIEQESNTHISVPMRGSRSTKVIIKGNTEEDVIIALERLNQITKIRSYSSPSNTRTRQNIPWQKFTHFLSISFATDEMKRNFALFRDEIMSNPETSHLHESMLQQPEKLHITISMLVLNHDDKCEAVAFDYLKECKSSIIDPVLQGQPLILTAAGVDIFSDCKPNAVNVIFGKVESQPLQEIANKMARFFESRGLVKQERENAALHLTLVNTFLYRNTENSMEDDIEDARIKKKKCFDATSILQKYKDFHFGSLTVKEIHICRLGTKTADGNYESAGILEI